MNGGYVLMEDLTGMKFNRLTVVSFSHFDKKKNGYWVCKCDCGKIKTIVGFEIKSGGTKSCRLLEK